VLDGHDPAGHEAEERHDRHRHVHVEDLLDEALVGVVGRVEEDEREGRQDAEHGGHREWLEALGVHRTILDVA
jgi:hypothetical protein